MIFPAVFSRAEEGEISKEPFGEQLEVRLETSPLNPVVNKPWSVFILVKHPIPQEVSVIPPPFPPSLAVERVRTDTRLNLEEERWTRVEYLFTPGRVETISLGPFEVRTPFAQAAAGGVSVRFREEPVARRLEPVFRWLVPVPAVSTGEKAELLLELSNWESGRKPPEAFFRGRAPPNAIIEETPPPDVLPAAAGNLFRYTVGVIPLEESGVTLESFSFRFDDYTLTVPKITIPVLPATPAEEVAADFFPGTPATRRDEFFPPVTAVSGMDAPVPFPETREKVFFLFQGEYGRIVAEARALWNERRGAETLARLRASERDSLSGPFLVPLRREIEEAMGLGFTENERWRPFRIPLAACVVFCAAFIFILALLIAARSRPALLAPKIFRRVTAPLSLLKKKKGSEFAFPGPGPSRRVVTFRGINGFISVIILILAAGLLLIILEEGFGNFPPSASSGNAAVLRTAQAYAVPDPRGTALDRFAEGQPVIVGDSSGDWCLAETPDGRSGWVKRESVITY